MTELALEMEVFWAKVFYFHYRRYMVAPHPLITALPFKCGVSPQLFSLLSPTQMELPLE